MQLQCKRGQKMKKCIFCKKELDKEDVMDVCKPCGFAVWGPKMYEAIKENMEQAKADGDLYQGSITDTFTKSTLKSRKETKDPEIDLVGFEHKDDRFSFKSRF